MLKDLEPFLYGSDCMYMYRFHGTMSRPRLHPLPEWYLLATADELGEVAGVDVDVVVLNGVVDVLPDVVLLGLQGHVLERPGVTKVTVLYPDVRHQLLLVQTVRDPDLH